MAKRKSVLKYRKFGNKRYRRSFATYKTKSEAIHAANGFRYRGNKARVIPVSGGYKLYTEI